VLGRRRRSSCSTTRRAGTERSYNGLRLANALGKREREQVRVFLIADAVGSMVAGQRRPNGYNLERLLSAAARHGAGIGLCGTRIHARAVGERALLRAARRSSLEELADRTLRADKVVSF
jgi:uncharacterized protein involved in oxidation of intracellular sulfur